MNFFKYPSVQLAMHVPMLFSVHKEPPKGLDFDPRFGYDLESDPFPPKMLGDFDPNEIADSLHLEFEYRQAILKPEKTYLQHFNHDQRWIIGCNVLHTLEKFIGEILDERSIYYMKMEIKKVIYYLTQRELKPGVWDENG